MASIAAEEYAALTEDQKTLHSPEDTTKSGMFSRFIGLYKRVTWSSQQTMEMAAQATATSIVFSATTTMHYMLHSYISQVLPRIEVKDKFRKLVKVAWTHNVANNVIPDAAFTVDDTPLSRMDRTWFDMSSQFYTPEGFWDSQSEIMGNTQQLEAWQDILPETTVACHLPWFYSYSLSSAFPLFLLSSQTRVEQKCSKINNPLALLRMVIFTAEKRWREIPPDDKYIAYGTMVNPRCWCKYAYITEQEKNYTRSCDTKKIVYIRDVVINDHPTPCANGDLIKIAIECKLPCLALFWAAKNLTASKLNRHSNYTTNPSNVYQGRTPIEHVSLSYGGDKEVFKAMESFHFERMEPRYRLPRAPKDKGYGALCNSFYTEAESADTTIVYPKLAASLEFKINDDDPYTTRSSKKSEVEIYRDPSRTESKSPSSQSSSRTTTEEPNNYKICLRLLCLRTLVFTAGDNGVFNLAVK